jgi:hypothetical protein
VSGGVERPDLECSYRQDIIVFEECVVARQHGRVFVADPDVNAGFTYGLDGLDVVPVAMGFHDLLYPQGPGNIKQTLVFIGCIDEKGFTRLAAPHHVDVVFYGSDDKSVDFGRRVRPD